MKSTSSIRAGDFTTLAKMYSLYRPSYSITVLDAIIGITKKPPTELTVADVGAGTGIWTRMLTERGCQNVIAVEPNIEMRSMGQNQKTKAVIDWRQGTGEMTGLASESIDLLSMASSFHWVDFDMGTREFHRVLKKGGHFVSLWNPRIIEGNTLLEDIENKVHELAPTMKRISSGKSNFVEDLSRRLKNSSYFEDLVYLEGRHTVNYSQEQYLGVWKSVSDIRSQMGEAIFASLLTYIENRIAEKKVIACEYLTRAWIVKNK